MNNMVEQNPAERSGLSVFIEVEEYKYTAFFLRFRFQMNTRLSFHRSREHTKPLERLDFVVYHLDVLISIFGSLLVN